MQLFLHLGVQQDAVKEISNCSCDLKDDEQVQLVFVCARHTVSVPARYVIGLVGSLGEEMMITNQQIEYQRHLSRYLRVLLLLGLLKPGFHRGGRSPAQII